MLKNKHVMVRVGGGWDTLANYLLKHDCQKMVKIPTPTSKFEKLENHRKYLSPKNNRQFLPKKEGGYLFPVSPRYKSQSPTTKPTTTTPTTTKNSPAIQK